MQVRLPTQDIVINACSGSYYSKEGFSAKGRKLDVGMLDVDNDALHGGGTSADFTINACFQFLEDLTDSRRFAGMACGQPCAPGSVKRLKQIEVAPGEEKPYCPPP
eukprot:248782-Prymnesium_polylepis.1